MSVIQRHRIANNFDKKKHWFLIISMHDRVSRLYVQLLKELNKK